MTDIADSRKHVVWIVEDSPLEAALAARVLAPEFRVLVFADGATAAEELGITSEPPDVIIADWVLPGIDGLELCRIVRQSHDELALPFMIVTAREGRDQCLEALEGRANDLITKPFDPQELRARVRGLARVRKLHQRSLELESALELFVGTVSHDLRTPLHAMSGYASMMVARDDLPEKHQHWARRIVAVGARMGRMLDELIEVTQLRGGDGIRLARRPTRLKDIVLMVVEEMQAAHPDAVITCAIDGDNEGVWDADALSRVIQNILGNALIHGAPGAPITIDVREQGPDSVVVIRNQGRPVPDELRGTIFQAFRGAKRPGKGLGLGLYITRELVKAHGGDITFTSSAEEGTAFEVTLPRAAALRAPGSERRPLA